MKMRRIQKPELLLFLLALALLPTFCHAQFDTLLQETQEFKNNSKALSREIVYIIKIIAGVAICLMGLAYLYIRDQQSDLANKLGKAILGIAIFLTMIAIGEQIANY